MNWEIIFLIEKLEEKYYTAKSLEYSIFTEANSYPELKQLIIDSVKCHFEKDDMPSSIKLFLKEEIDII